VSNDSRTIGEAGVGAKVRVISGIYVEVLEKLDGGWFKCETPEGVSLELHETCKLDLR
jgi:hypothetical protein